jgi:hypothetical protein
MTRAGRSTRKGEIRVRYTSKIFVEKPHGSKAHEISWREE